MSTDASMDFPVAALPDDAIACADAIHPERRPLWARLAVFERPIVMVVEGGVRELPPDVGAPYWREMARGHIHTLIAALSGASP